MPGKVVVIAQQKGGAGKTTLAVQLAVAWQQAGKKVAMLDVDPQGSLAAWRGLRDRTVGEDTGPSVQTLSGWRLGNQLSSAGKEADLIVVDSPPHAETDAKAAIRTADLVVLPIQPTMLDLWATEATLALAEAEKTKALLVLNRMPPRSLAADAVAAEIKKNKWPLAKTSLGNRQAFVASINEGKGVAETARRSLAGKEIDALAKEVLRRLR
ncbi:MAG: ParA family protein [Alphaproteobacteria bacterium]|nr:ParA family protein [Alphaproteobacteria bacterium]